MKSKTKSPSGQQAPIATTDDREIQSRGLLHLPSGPER